MGGHTRGPHVRRFFQLADRTSHVAPTAEGSTVRRNFDHPIEVVAWPALLEVLTFGVVFSSANRESPLVIVVDKPEA